MTRADCNTERNKELYDDYKSGTSIVDLVVKYRITSTRIYQIIHEYEERFNKKSKK